MQTKLSLLAALGVVTAASQAFAVPTPTGGVLKLPAVAAVSRIVAANRHYPFHDEDYPFQEGYSFPKDGLGSVQEHAVLTVPNTRVRQSAVPQRFDVDIRLYNDTGWTQIYNAFWDRLIPLPGRLALYDGQMRYVCDLLESMGGSQKTVDAGDWTGVQAPGYVGAIVSASLPYPTYLRIPAGTYYLQVIYLQRALWRPTEISESQHLFGNNAEAFRSNAVKITVLD